MIDRIFLGKDGVIVDWTGAAILACGGEPAEVYRSWPEGCYDLATALGISGNEMWRHVHRGGAEFWANLAPYPWWLDLVRACNAIAPTTILTSPSREPCSLAGKLMWMQRHLGPGYTDYLIGPDKTPCARPGAVLIDDRERGCDAFTAAGGRSILFPQTWNGLGRMADPVAYVVQQLERMRNDPRLIKVGSPS